VRTSKQANKQTQTEETRHNAKKPGEKTSKQDIDSDSNTKNNL